MGWGSAPPHVPPPPALPEFQHCRIVIWAGHHATAALCINTLEWVHRGAEHRTLSSHTWSYIDRAVDSDRDSTFTP